MIEAVRGRAFRKAILRQTSSGGCKRLEQTDITSATHNAITKSSKMAIRSLSHFMMQTKTLLQTRWKGKEDREENGNAKALSLERSPKHQQFYEWIRTSSTLDLKRPHPLSWTLWLFHIFHVKINRAAARRSHHKHTAQQLRRSKKTFRKQYCQ